MRYLVVVILTCLVAVLVSFLAPIMVRPAHALVIYNSPGGIIVEFERQYAAIQARHEQVQVLGTCASACTMVLGLPRGEACAGPSAMLGFHAGSLWFGGQPWQHATDELARHYPPAVRAWYLAGPGRSLAVTWVPARKFLPPCK